LDMSELLDAVKAIEQIKTIQEKQQKVLEALIVRMEALETALVAAARKAVAKPPRAARKS